MKKERRHHSAEQKVTILRRHLLEKVPISDLCEEFGLQPTVFYRWQKEFFENGAAAFQHKGRSKINRPSRSESRIWRRRSRPKTRSSPS
jgi:transposase